jgi:antitoxin component YwqK of YwqJK toxin-antitoxin module
MTQTVNQALMDKYFFPYFRQKRYFEGTYHGLNGIIDLLEIRLKLNRSNDSQGKKLMDYEVKFDNGLFYYAGKLFTGIGIDMWNEKQLKSEISFKNGKIDGVARSYHENGNLQSQRFWKEGKAHGEFKVYSEGGQLVEEGAFKDGQMDSVWKKYFESCKLKAEMSYIDGKLDGLVKEYNETGKLKSQATYKEGKKIE